MCAHIQLTPVKAGNARGRATSLPTESTDNSYRVEVEA